MTDRTEALVLIALGGCYDSCPSIAKDARIRELEAAAPPDDEAQVERVARALCDAIGVPQEGNVLNGNKIEIAWHTQIPKARAAIAAMPPSQDGWRGFVAGIEAAAQEVELAALTVTIESDGYVDLRPLRTGLAKTIRALTPASEPGEAK